MSPRSTMLRFNSGSFTLRNASRTASSVMSVAASPVGGAPASGGVESDSAVIVGESSLVLNGGRMRKILGRGLKLALVLAPLTAWAQTAPTERPAARGWEKVGLPALNYNTDEGFGYGVLAEIYNYGEGVRPYKYTV